MEDVLDVYSGDHDDGTVLVCVDETSKQQTKETREPLPVRPGSVRRLVETHSRALKGPAM